MAEKKDLKMWNMKIDGTFHRRLYAVVEAIDTDASKFVRQAVSEKMERLAEQNPKVAEILNQQAA